uniref:K Homology domain-containing protein n=1 Tax=Bactrocera latifrons TaxID=174628 RepID=A0A0K8VCQ3_BACLA
MSHCVKENLDAEMQKNVKAAEEKRKKDLRVVALFSAKINIPLDCIGMILGHQGTHIKIIEKVYKVKVNINKRSGNAFIAGKKFPNVKDAYKYIERQLKACSEKNNKRQGATSEVQQRDEIVDPSLNEYIFVQVDWAELGRKQKEADEARGARFRSAKEAERKRRENAAIRASVLRMASWPILLLKNIANHFLFNF